MHNLSRIVSEFNEVARRSIRGGSRPAFLVLRWIVPAVLVAVLAYSLSKIGWLHVWNSRPTSLAFYLVVFLPAFAQPLADLIIYRRLWGVGRALRFPVLLRKQYLNSSVIGYSGEAYFFLWAQRHLNLKKENIVHAIKDSNVLSGGAGLAMLGLVLALVVATGGLSALGVSSFNPLSLVPIVLLPLALCVVLVVGGRRVTTLRRGQMATVFSIHLARGAVVLVLAFLQWWLSGALPSAAICLEFVAMRLLFSRLPLVPNKGLVFVGVAMAAASVMNLSAARVAAVLIIMGLADQLLGLALVGIPWLVEQFDGRIGRGSQPRFRFP